MQRYPAKCSSTAGDRQQSSAKAVATGGDRVGGGSPAHVGLPQALTATHDGVENAVQVEIRRYIAACGKDYLALWEQGGQTPEQSVSIVEMEAYQALGCRIANIDLEEFRRTPEGLRTVTCSQERFVPSKAKWWLVIYVAGRVSFAAGPYDHIDECAHSKEADAMLQQNPSCELSAFSPVVGESGEPPSP